MVFKYLTDMVMKAAYAFLAAMYSTPEMRRELWNNYHQGTPLTKWGAINEHYSDRAGAVKRDRVLWVTKGLILILFVIGLCGLMVKGILSESG